jgi:hypothetical protein
VISFLGRERDAAALISIAALILVVPYTFIGVNRLVVGGVQVLIDDTILGYIHQSSTRYSYFGFSAFSNLIWAPAVAVLFKIGFIVTTCFETCSAGILLSNRFRTAWVATMVVFHFTTLFTMNIFFWENLILILAVFGRASLVHPAGIPPYQGRIGGGLSLRARWRTHPHRWLKRVGDAVAMLRVGCWAKDINGHVPSLHQEQGHGR